MLTFKMGHLPLSSLQMTMTISFVVLWISCNLVAETFATHLINAEQLSNNLKDVKDNVLGTQKIQVKFLGIQ